MNLLEHVVLRSSASNEVNLSPLLCFNNLFVIRLPVRKARGMVEEMGKGPCVFTEDPKRREESSHAIVKLNFLFAYEQHDGDGRRQRLCQRSQIKNRGGLHETLRRNKRTRPERLLIYNFSLPTNEQDCAGEYSISNSF